MDMILSVNEKPLKEIVRLLDTHCPVRWVEKPDFLYSGAD